MLSKLYYNRQEDMDKILKIEVLKNKRNEGTGKIKTKQERIQALSPENQKSFVKVY